MENRKRSFFERITGSINLSDEREDSKNNMLGANRLDKKPGGWAEEEPDEAELTVDVYQTPTHIVVQSMIAGVKPEDIEISIGRDTMTIRGKREESRSIDEDKYFIKELYWGSFSRTLSLPAEVEPEEVEATERHGLLNIKMQKVDKDRKNTVKVRSI